MNEYWLAGPHINPPDPWPHTPCPTCWAHDHPFLAWLSPARRARAARYLGIPMPDYTEGTDWDQYHLNNLKIQGSDAELERLLRHLRTEGDEMTAVHFPDPRSPSQEDETT
jgi:hypothetical protein